MSELPTPSAARLRGARWLDSRLLLGVVLVLLSVVLGAKVVAEADDSVPVWGLAHDVAPDAVLTAEDLRRVDVRLDESIGQYIRADGGGPVGLVATRELRRGELLPVGAVVRRDLAGLRRVTVPVDAAVAEGLERHAVVDVYVVPEPVGQQAPGPARRVLEAVTVAAEPGEGGRLRAAGRATAGVELLVPDDRVQQLLTELARGTATVVEVPKLRADAQDGR